MRHVVSFFMLFLLMNIMMVAQEFTHSIIAENVQYMMLLDSHDRLWYSNGETIVMYDGAVQTFDIPVHKHANRLWEDTNGIIWGASPEGIIRYTNNTWQTYPFGDDVPKNAAPVMIFKDKSQRVYFFSETQPMYGPSKHVVCIWDNEKITCISDNLPDRINYVVDYKGGAVFGNKRRGESCGHYDGNYQLETEGEVYDFYNSWGGLFSSDATNLKNPEMFEKYQPIKKVSLQNDTLLFVTNNQAVCYFSSSNSFQEWDIPADFQDFTDRYLVYLFYQDEAFYLVHADKGVLEVKADAVMALNKNNKLAGNEVKWVFSDEHNHLVLLHPKKSSLLIDGQWRHFDKKAGYELNDLEVRNHFHLFGNEYIIGYNTSGLGKKNVLLTWDNNSWESIAFKLKYQYLQRVPPFVFQDMIWCKYHNGNTYKGLIYYNMEEFVEYPLGKKVKENMVQDVLFSENTLYVHSAMSKTGLLYKVVRKK